MTNTEWNKIKRCVNKYGQYTFKDRCTIYQWDGYYGNKYSVRDTTDQCIDVDWNLDNLRYLFED